MGIRVLFFDFNALQLAKAPSRNAAQAGSSFALAARLFYLDRSKSHPPTKTIVGCIVACSRFETFHHKAFVE